MKLFNFTKKYRNIKKSAILSFVVLFSVFLNASQASAYIGDVESASGNSFIAGSLDFSLSSPADFSPAEVSPTTPVARSIAVANDGTLGFEYELAVINTTGDLCPALNIVAKLDGNEEYDGPMVGANIGPFTFVSPEDWTFDAELASSDPILEGTNCEFDFEYTALQENAILPLPAGFNDAEILHSVITAVADFGSVSSCPVGAPTEEITGLTVGSIFDYTDKHVIVRSTGKLKASAQLLDISTNCDFTVESGGQLIASQPSDSGDIFLTVGGDLSVAGLDAIKTASVNSAGVDVSGDVNIDVTGDFDLTGGITTYAQENTGNINITVGGNMTVENVAKIFAKAGNSTSTNTGGNVDINISGDFTFGGEIDAYGQEQGGTVDVDVSGAVNITGNLISAKASLSSSSVNTGGIIRIRSVGSMTVSGFLDVSGQEQGGIVELLTQGVFILNSTGQIKSNSDNSSSTNSGGNISVISRGSGASTFSGQILANGQEQGGNIAITTLGNSIFTNSVTVSAGTSTDPNLGGTIVITTPAQLSIASSISASGTEGNGNTKTNYCTKDFTGAVFTPAPVEITNCSSVILNEFLPNPTGADDALMPGGEWVEIYNYGTSAMDLAGWFLYDGIDSHDLEITALNTGSASTIVPAGGFLVVYKNGAGGFALNNTGGDTVRLYDGEIGLGGTLRDSHAYTESAPDDKSFARVLDGGVWYDPEPTPGGSNAGTFNYKKFFFDVVAEDMETESEIAVEEIVAEEVIEVVKEEIVIEETEQMEEIAKEEIVIEEVLVEEIEEVVKDDAKIENVAEETVIETEEIKQDEEEIEEVKIETAEIITETEEDVPDEPVVVEVEVRAEPEVATEAPQEPQALQEETL